MEKRLVMCWWFEIKIEEDDDFFDDDGSRSVDVSIAVTVYLGAETPDGVPQCSLHFVKCTAGVAISKH